MDPALSILYWKIRRAGPFGGTRLFPAAAAVLFCLFAPVGAPAGTRVLLEKDRVVFAVGEGRSRAQMTEVWTARTDGSESRLIRRFFGAPGELLLLPGGEELLYLERGLRFAAFGSHFYGGHNLPLIRNRVWRLPVRGEHATRWPLPDDMQAFTVAVSPGGKRIAVAGFRGSLPEGGDPGLWVVDRQGKAALLLSGRVSGPLLWTPERIYCRLEERRLAVHPETGDTTAAEVLPGTQDPAAELSGDSTRPDGVRFDRFGKALDQYMRGYQAIHQGDVRTAKEACKMAIEALESLYEQRETKISRADCGDYIREIRRRADLDKEGRLELVCREHQLVLGDLIRQYAQAHGGKRPVFLEALQTWAGQELVEKQAGEATRKRDLKVLERLFFCEAAPQRQRPISYVYGPAAGMRLACYWHRGRVVRLAEKAGQTRVEVVPFHPEQLEARVAAAETLLATGRAQEAVFLLEVAAHQRRRDPVMYNRLGDAAFQAEAYGRAEEAYHRAASLGKGEALARAYYGLGRISMHRPKGLYTAIEYFRDALIQDRGYADARYQMARARYLLWEYDAKSDIEEVLRMDPQYAEAYLLMGDWYAKLKEDFEQAIVWYTKYLALRPEDVEGHRRLNEAYLQVEDYDGILETLLGFVQEHPEAVELMPILAQACARREQQEQALHFFETYISKLDPEERRYYEDIGPFASQEEMAVYERTSGAARKAFLKRFWNSRDPDLSTRVNERLLEHYRRVWYVRQNFSEGKQPWDRRGEVYIRFGEPDHRTSSKMMNAQQSLAVQRVKERIAYEMYGQEGFGETYVGPVFPVRSLGMRRRNLEALEDTYDEDQIIVENTDDAQLDITIAGPAQQRQGGATGNGQSPGGGNNQSGFSDQISGDMQEENETQDLPGAVRGSFSEDDGEALQFGQYRPVTASGNDVSTVSWESWVYTRVGGGIEITFTDESGKGAYDYAPLPVASEISASQMVTFTRYAPENVFRQAVGVTPDFYAPEFDVPPFDFYFDVADFRGENGHSTLEIYYGMPRSAARYFAEEDVTRLVVKRQAALISEAEDTVYRTLGEVVFQAPGRKDGGGFVPDVARLEAPPGVYRLEVRAWDRMGGRLGLYRKNVRVEEYGPGQLRLSDLELAWQISEGERADAFSKKGLQVIPMPTRMYRHGQNVFVYYEVYNLTPDEFGRMKYRVEYTIGPKGGGVLSRLARTFTGAKEEVAVGYERRGRGESEAVYTELDPGKSEPGEHYLRVEVTDLNSGNVVRKETFFKVAE